VRHVCLADVHQAGVGDGDGAVVAQFVLGGRVAGALLLEAVGDPGDLKPATEVSRQVDVVDGDQRGQGSGRLCPGVRRGGGRQGQVCGQREQDHVLLAHGAKVSAFGACGYAISGPDLRRRKWPPGHRRP
jgi:hypothetical protein